MIISMLLYAYDVNILLSCRRCQLRFIVFNLLTLKVAMLILFLYRSKLSLGSVADYSKSGARG